MELVEYPTSFHPIVEVIVRFLSFTDLKSLSLCSKGWLRATEVFLVERSEIHNILNNNRIIHLDAAWRTYRNYYFHDLASKTAVKNFELLAVWYGKAKKRNEHFRIRSIKIQNVVITDGAVKYLNLLECVNTLNVCNCDLACDDEEEMSLWIKISVMKVQTSYFDSQWRRFSESIVEKNPDLKFILNETDFLLK